MKNFIFLVLLLCLFYSCDGNRHTVELLTKAQNVVESNPAEALALLDSIRNPKDMGTDNYMKYIVVRVQAKDRCNKDITGDTIIFEAQHYFDKKNNLDEAASANYYAGAVYIEKNIPEKALECYLKAENYASKANDNLYIAKSFHSIGYLYYKEDIIDSAIINYSKALNYYRKLKNTESYELQVINSIGLSYYALYKLDSSFQYYNQGLELAKEKDNKYYKALLTHQLGMVYRENKEYDKAAIYLNNALKITTEPIDSIRIYLNLSKLYNYKNEIDSAKHYISFVKERISSIKYAPLLRSAYGSLAEYNRQSGNFEESEYYRDLQYSTDLKIKEEQNAEKLLTVENQFQLSLKDKELTNLQMRYYILLLIVISAILISILILRNIRQKHRKEKILLGLEKELLNQQIESLSFLKGLYQNLIFEWSSIEKQVKALRSAYGAIVEPDLYVKIRQMVDNLKVKTNRQLIDRAKIIILKHPCGKKALENLNDNDLLIIMLCHFKYNMTGIASILNIAYSSRNIYFKKLDVRNKLVWAGFTEREANIMLIV